MRWFHNGRTRGRVGRLGAAVLAALGTGYATRGIAPIFATVVPAVLDPAFRDSTLDPGYLTTQVGTVTPFTRLVDVPVLTVMASGDQTFCGLLATDCGSSDVVVRWADRTVGRTSEG